jgi:hypothetical protein
LVRLATNRPAKSSSFGIVSLTECDSQWSSLDKVDPTRISNVVRFQSGDDANENGMVCLAAGGLRFFCQADTARQHDGIPAGIACNQT